MSKKSKDLKRLNALKEIVDRVELSIDTLDYDKPFRWIAWDEIELELIRVLGEEF